MKNFKPAHFNWRVEGAVAVVTLKRPERKNPMTFNSYAELRDTFRRLAGADDIAGVVFGSAGGNFARAATSAPS
jgi:enoyl-CoA hydratase/carnithine racemase